MVNKKHLFPIVLVISLFFLWAVTSNLLPILIPHLKKACKLNVMESSLVDSAYWIAYFVIALPAGILMKKAGYKTAIITGLLLAAAGAFLFYPAAESRSFGFFLFALFIVAAGMTFLETSANPFITILGNPDTSSQRLNFAQAFNGMGAFIATMFISKAIIGNSIRSDEELAAFTPEQEFDYYEQLFHSLKLPYIIIGLVLVLVAILFIITRFPPKQAMEANRGSTTKERLSFFKHPNLMGGVIAQFFYVGAQVCVSSFFILYAKDVVGISEYEATTYLGFLLLAFMVGRYVGAFLMNYFPAEKLLTTYALINIVLSAYIVVIGGKGALWAFIGVEFFMSIMYPTIFSLAIRGLGEKTAIASSYMVMAIVGGAVFPPLLGYISDSTASLQWAYVVPLICFIPVWYYGRMQSRRKDIAG
ncbi:MAG TPA: L-fucose:H+ symporter permease [Parasegetibacter sp.]